ncbi:hypothetical protein BCR42DRAFT_421682 [Absidia repens]|uniref:Uncharacterized protein n=1 Tax=Absidia repens TaxID=90262 RepID=A0A1X2I7Q1_9FUNG|nr:hypothetical protein BCR42DRAFT_421682 [Absidia repens]
MEKEALFGTGTLSSRIFDVCNMETHNDLHGYIRHSISRFGDYFNGNPLFTVV